MAVSAEQSWQGTILRFEAMKALGMIARTTDKGHHDMVVSALPENLENFMKADPLHGSAYTRVKKNAYMTAKKHQTIT